MESCEVARRWLPLPGVQQSIRRVLVHWIAIIPTHRTVCRVAPDGVTVAVSTGTAFIEVKVQIGEIRMGTRVGVRSGE